MYQAYAADPQMRINVGIRRRLAPLLENSRPRIELLNSLLFSMPGTPIIYYGDEIGMGDNIYLGDRNGVRTPMQWTGDRNGGFSRADPARLFAPAIMDPVYGYQSINVEAQERSPFSLLNWMKRMIGLRKQYGVFGRGTIEFQSTHNRKVLAYVRRDEADTILCVANLARSVQPVELDLSRFKGLIPVEMLGLTEFPRIGELPYFLTLPGYAFYWFRLQHAPSPLTARVAPDTAAEAPHAPPLFVGAAWDTLLDGNVRTLIERDRLLPFLHRQRWFGGKARPSRAARFADWGTLRRGPQPLFFTVVEVTFEDGSRDRYFLPLAICPYADARPLEERTPHAILAAVTGARRGLLFDASLDDRFARTILDALEREEQVMLRRGTIRALRCPRVPAARGTNGADFRVWRLSAEQSNTSIVYGTRLIAKLFRRLQEGVNPDYEVGRYLTEKVGFERVPAIAGAFEYSAADLAPTTIAMVQELVESQADGWSHATDDVARFYDQVEARTPPPLEPVASYSALLEQEVPTEVQGVMGGYLETAAVLGRRTAQMHLALASDASDAAFAPEPFTPMDLDRVAVDIAGQARAALDTLAALDLEPAPSRLPADVAGLARQLLAMRERLLDGSRTKLPMEFTASKTRIHGDYHLGQVLWAEGDYYILDFEGEPARPLAERRDKQSPLKDVAGMVRSYSYAAYAALFAHAATRPGDFQRLEPWARIWHTWATAAFLRAYFATADKALFVPAAPSQRDALLGLFVLGKALYELNYELHNRPDWVRIPLWGILELLNAG
jgi:maltose alpha-D-glucosyltransferase/alpha-amylase